MGVYACMRFSVCICFLSDAGRYKKSKVVLENTFYTFLGLAAIIRPHLSGTHDSSFDQKKMVKLIVCFNSLLSGPQSIEHSH